MVGIGLKRERPLAACSSRQSAGAVLCPNEESETGAIRMRSIYFLAALLVASRAIASDAVTVEPGHSSYSYVSQYKFEIDAPRNVVGEFLE